MAAPFDLSSLEITAPAVPVLEGIGADRAVQPSRVAISDTGTLIYLPDVGGNTSERSLSWINHEGKMTPLSDTHRDYVRARFSPDGSHLSVAIRAEEGGETEVYILERERDLLRRLTKDLDVESSHVWSPDGKWIVFAMEKDGEKSNLYRIPSDFSGEAERLTTSQNSQKSTDISPDGRLLAITQYSTEKEGDVVLLRLDEQGHIEGEPYAIAESPLGIGVGDSRLMENGSRISLTNPVPTRCMSKPLRAAGQPYRYQPKVGATQGGRRLKISCISSRIGLSMKCMLLPSRQKKASSSLRCPSWFSRWT